MQIDFLKASISNKTFLFLDKYLEKLKQLEASKVKCKNIEHPRDVSNEIPEFEDGENEHFAYASAKIKMRYVVINIGSCKLKWAALSNSIFLFSYDKVRGRHVVANTKIHKGDVLFIEKAFIFAPVFRENKEFYLFKCYNCLKDIIITIP